MSMLLLVFGVLASACNLAFSPKVSSLKMTIDPSSGPDGTEATITISGAEPGAPITFNLPGGTIAGSADADGNFTHTDRFTGCAGDVTTAKATVGWTGSEQEISATFTITEPACASDTSQPVAQADTSALKMAIDPPSGPDGTEATITISGAEPGAPITFNLPGGTIAGSADADGNFTHTDKFTGCAGDVTTANATVGWTGNEQEVTATFTITEPACPGDESGTGTDVDEDPNQMTIDPASGPSGTPVTITITGAKPGEPVTLYLPGGAVAGTTDANGTFTHKDAFYGNEGDVIQVEATVGTTGEGRNVSATFTITGPLDQSYNVGVGVESDPGGHAEFIDMPEQLELHASQGSIIIEGPNPWVMVSGELDAEGNFTATGIGTVAGFSGIAVVFEGTITQDSLVGEYTMGAEGGLPGGKAITYSIES